MEGVGEVAEKALIEGLGEDVVSKLGPEAEQELVGEISEQMGNLTGDRLANLPEAELNAMTEEIDSWAKQLKSEIHEVEGGKLEIDMEAANKLAVEANTGFIDKLETIVKDNGISIQEQAVLEDFPNASKVIKGAKVVPHDVVDVPEPLKISLDKESPKVVARDISHDDVLQKQNNIKEIYKGGPGDLTTAKSDLDAAQEVYNKNAKSLKTEAQDNVLSARKETLQSEYNLKRAREAGDDDAIAQRKGELTENKAAAKDAEKTNQELIKRQANQEYEQAKGARDLAKKKVKYYEGLHGKGSNATELTDAQGELKEAEEAVTTSRKKLLDNSGWFENNSVRMGNVGRKLIEGFKASPGFLWTHFGSQLIGGILFGLGPMGMQAIEDVFNNISQINNLKKIQKFGGILMKLPNEFINNEQPANSKFVYVGVPYEGQPLNDEFLKTANYYAAFPEYGTVASSAINDANNFPNVMIHLNTGYVFVGDGQPNDPDNMTVPLLEATGKTQSLKEILDALSGEVASGAKGEVYQYYQLNRSTGYKGNPFIGSLFATPAGKGENLYPPLLNQTIMALQNGLKFGNYSVQGIRGLNGTPLAKFIAPSEQLGTDEPYVAKGVHIYQTKDTPFIQNIRSSLSPDNPEDKAALDNLVDYVVFMDDQDNIIPLQVPIPQPPYNYATYILNPEIKYMASLLQEEGYLYTTSGLTTYKAPAIKISDLVQGDQMLANQIDVIKTYCSEQAVKGPFSYGSVTLTIDPTLLAANTFIYKAADYLGKGIDDYFIGIDAKKNILQLPSADLVLFVSLVTSRSYNAVLQPYGNRTLTNTLLPLYIYQTIGDDSTSGTPFVTNSVPDDVTKYKLLYTGKSPLYTLFMEYPFNPLFGKDIQPPIPAAARTAFGQYWALNQLKMGSNTVKTFLGKSALLTAIYTTHDKWIATLDKNNPSYITDQMGPFDFAQTTLGPIQVQAVSDDAIAKQNYVYVSDNYPDEYLVMADDPTGKNIGQAFGGQSYAISLSNGNVYAAAAQPTANKLPGSKVSQPPLNVDTLVKRAHITISSLLQKITDSQAAYTASIINNLYGPGTGFGTVLLYLNKQDYFADQFIYADVTNLPSPLDAKGNEVASVIQQVNDYYVCVERTAALDSSNNPIKDVQGNTVYNYEFGTQLGANTYSIVSLISGATFDRTGNYLGSYGMFKIKDTITDVLGFANRTLGIIAQKTAPLPLRSDLVKKIKTLAQQTVTNIKAYGKQIADQEAADKKIYAPLNSDVIAQLKTLPFVDNPNLLPRYLKQYKLGSTLLKYYVMTPGYVFSTPPANTPATNFGPDTTFIDFNITQTYDSGMGMVYDSTGQATGLLTGWALLQARNFAGVVVNAQGQQQRMLGVTVSTLPMQGTKTKDNPSGQFMIPATGFESIKAGAQFDFYYHTQIDAFFVKVTSGVQSYYIDLASGYGYNLDGTPRWFESEVYTDKTGNKLLIGYDADDVKKVALAPSQAVGKPLSPYGFYTMVGQFAAMETKDYKVQGTYFEMVNDANPDQKIRVMWCTTNSDGSKIDVQHPAMTGETNPFYLVWNVSATGQFTLLGKYDKDPGLYYSLLLYAQTRDTGQPVEQGVFNTTDNYITDIDNIPLTPARPKTYGIVFDKQHTLLGVLYQNQLCMFNPGTMTTFYNKTNTTDGSVTKQQITVKINKQSIQPNASNGIGLMATWLTIQDGGTSYDFEFDYYLLNPEFEVCDDSTTFHLNLALLKQGSISQLQKNNYCEGGFGGLNVSSFVPFGTPVTGVGRRALVSQLNAEKSAGTVYFPASVPTNSSLRTVPMKSAGNVTLDNTGNMFIYKKVKGTINRYVYPLGQPQDAGQTYYTPESNGWSVDISNGILYDETGFPTGQSLNSSQLLTLLDLLQLSVGYDKNGLPYRLEYRYAAPPAAQKK